jgi:hypothetical protein
MKRWAWLVAALYGLIIIALTLPTILLAFAPQAHISEAGQVFGTLAYWLWLAVMVVSQFALLAVPVRFATRRPLTRGALWPTVLAGGLMAGGLVVGAGYSIVEVISGGHSVGSWPWIIIIGGVCVWGIWSAVFFRLSRRLEPTDWFSRQCRTLLKGSILELLIAVPTHIVARSRDYCCAGFMTFIGLTMGISVMLFSFGPAVFFLYADRWKRLHPKANEFSTGNSNP